MCLAEILKFCETNKIKIKKRAKIFPGTGRDVPEKSDWLTADP